MKKLPMWYLVVLILYLLTLLINLIFILYRDSKLPVKELGVPKIIIEEIHFDECSITEIVDDGTYIYILADSHDGYIQVYDFAGNYQKTISLYSKSISGSFSLSVSNNKVYIEDCNGNIYIYEAGEFQEFVLNTNRDENMDAILQTEYAGRFGLKQGSIWRFDLEHPVCVIQRSAYAIVHQYYIDDLILIVFFTITGVIILKNCRE